MHKDTELHRKLLHTGVLILPLMYHALADYTLMIILSGALTFIAFLIEWLRLTYASVQAVFMGLVGPLLRTREIQTITAASWMALALFLSILIFSQPVAVFVLTAFIAGDALASLIGRRWGRHALFNKTLEGSLAFLITALIAGWWLGGLPVWIWVTGALIMTTVESVPMMLNDNIRVPLIAGPLIELCFWIHTTFMNP